MGVQRYVVEAVVREGRSRREVAHSTGLSQSLGRHPRRPLPRRRTGGADPAVAPPPVLPARRLSQRASRHPRAASRTRRQARQRPAHHRPSPPRAGRRRPVGGHHLAHPQGPSRCNPHRQPTSASVPTAPTSKALSPCATSAGCATSPSAHPTGTAGSPSWSPGHMSAWWPSTAHCCANSPSIPSATTSPSAPRRAA